MEKQCECCGKLFIPPNRKYKYCSTECREKASISRRKLWEEKTNYREKNIDAVRRSRAKALQNRITEQEKQYAEYKALRKKEIDDAIAQDRKKDLELAAKGDYNAIMRTHSTSSIEYWNAYKEQQIQEINKWNLHYYSLINDISIFDDEFSQKVVESIKETGVIRGNTITLKK